MRKFWIIFFSLALLFLLAARASSNVGISVNWGAFKEPVRDNNGGILRDGSLVQLIWDVDGDGIDEPGEDGLPSGGDELLDISYTRSGSFFSGEFSRNTNLTEAGVGDRIYVRAWNAQRIEDATHYGDTRVVQPSLWTIDTAVGLTLDATEAGSWGTNILFLPNRVPLGKLCRGYRTTLVRNYPNPFQVSTAICYCIPGTRTWEMVKGGDRVAVYGATDLSLVDISVYDVSGRRVRKLISANRLPGYYRAVWDGRDDFGRKVSDGSYFCRLSVANSAGSKASMTSKMVLTR
ncbi:MAG: FlgD immunoglobulin-like domain containing protein [bacterium]